MYDYVEKFKKLGFGLFVHFGLYSCLEKGEWQYYHGYLLEKKDVSEYRALPDQFIVDKNWAIDLVKTAKNAGCKYIVLTTRHHDGFSLYDTCGLNNFDAPHSACGRDLIREFVDACRAGDVIPFFYHTLLDWYHPAFDTDFPTYIDYLVQSLEILCKNYGEIGGFWFDGMWSKPSANWEEDRLYATIRKYQPNTMIINNTGLSACGAIGHPEIDSVTFERGRPAEVNRNDRPRAGEVCDGLNDHWGFAVNDCNYKSVAELIQNLLECRKYNCNYLLNTGLMGNGRIYMMDQAILGEIGKWIRCTGNMIYNVRAADIQADNAYILTDGQYYYAVIKNVPMIANVNVAREQHIEDVVVHTNHSIKSAVWLDDGTEAQVMEHTIQVKPFHYGTSLNVRIARFELDKNV